MDKTLLQRVKDRFQSEPELREYIVWLDKLSFSSATLENFLYQSVEEIQAYFFWTRMEV